MIDEAMSAKYALPAGHSAESASKRRRPDNEENNEDTPRAARRSSGSGDREGKGERGQGKGGGHGRGKGDGGARQEGEGAGANRQHKGEGKGRGYGGRGKGKGEAEGGAGYSTNHVLSTQARLILRLESDRRDRDRFIQWAIDFKMPYDLPNILSNAVTVYRAAKPATGPHPEGALHDIQWALFADSLFTDMAKLDAAGENQEKIRRVVAMLKSSVYPKGELGPDLGRTSCCLFRPAHRLGEDQTVWTWLFRMRTDTSRGREVHELLLTCHAAISEIHSHINIRRDRTPKDGLVRQLETQLAGLRV